MCLSLLPCVSEHSWNCRNSSGVMSPVIDSPAVTELINFHLAIRCSNEIHNSPPETRIDDDANETSWVDWIRHRLGKGACLQVGMTADSGGLIWTRDSFEERWKLWSIGEISLLSFVFIKPYLIFVLLLIFAYFFIVDVVLQFSIVFIFYLFQVALIVIFLGFLLLARFRYEFLSFFFIIPILFCTISCIFDVLINFKFSLYIILDQVFIMFVFFFVLIQSAVF